MDRCDNPNSVICKICGIAYTLHEDDVLGNFPHVLLCGHIFCHACLRSLEFGNVILCPECKVESTLPEGGVDGLQVDSRIIGLIYTAKMNKMKSCRSDRAARHRRHNKISSPIKDSVESVEDVKQDNVKLEDTKQPSDVEKAVDEALAQAAENMAQLEHIHQSLNAMGYRYNGYSDWAQAAKRAKSRAEDEGELSMEGAEQHRQRQTLVAGLTMQAKREKARLLMEVDEAMDWAIRVLRKRKGVLLCELTNMEAHFPSSRQELGRVEERMRALETAMEKAKQVRQFPSLESYCNLDMVLQTLKAPVDIQSFDMPCISMGSGLSCIFQADSLNQSLKTCLTINAGTRKILSEEPPPRSQQQGGSNRRSSWRSGTPPGEGRRCSRISPSCREPSGPQQPDQDSSRNSRPVRSSPSSPEPQPRPVFINPPSDPGQPDVIIEEIIEEEQVQDRGRKGEQTNSARVAGLGDLKALPPTGPELASDRRTQRRKKVQLDVTSINQGKVFQWVLVTHVVNPNHFYIRHVAEKKEIAILSRKIHQFCSGDRGLFTPRDTLWAGSMIFVKWKVELWCRAIVTELSQTSSLEHITICPLSLLVRIRVFFLDYGFTKSITVNSEAESPDAFIKGVNEHLRRVDVAMQAEMNRWPPQAIKCSLKDIVPVDLTRGWTVEAQDEFRRAVGSAAVEMQVLGQDRETLLVDLKKAPMDRSLSDMPISLSEYLVFVEVAKFYSPVSWSAKTAQGGSRPLQYYPPVYPRINTELNAVVTYINNLSDFYIQLVDNMEFLLLTAKLQDCYNASVAVGGDDGLQLYCPALEQACVARFDDKYWYRAQVIGHPGGRKVEVRYVDFGNKKILSVNDLRKIKDEFFAIPAMGIQCCLSDVVPRDGEETWSDACTKKFISLADQKLVTAIATDRVPRSRPLPVRLFESSLPAHSGPSASISELLVTEELASFKKGIKPIEAKPAAVDTAVWDPSLQDLLGANGEARSSPGLADQMSPTEQSLEFQPQLQLPTCLKDLKVRVTHVNSPGSFYVQLTQNDPQLKWVCELLKQEYASSEPQEMDWKADMYCAAFINGVWERGQIFTNVTSSNIAEVVRCDFGNKVKLHVTNLRPLQPSLMGSLMLECALSDIRPAGGRSTWTATACDFISYYLTGALAIMTIKELTDARPVPVSLYCANQAGQDVSIADFLVSEGLALKERKPRVPAMPKLEEIVIEPQVSGVETPVSGVETPVSGFETQVSGFETQVSGFETQVNEFETQVSEFETQVGGFETQVNEFETPVSGFETQVSEFETPDSGFETQVGGFETQVNEFETPVSGFETQVSEFETPVCRFETQVSEFETPISGFETQVSEFETQVNRFETQLSGFETQVSGIDSPDDKDYQLSPLPAPPSLTPPPTPPPSLSPLSPSIHIPLSAPPKPAPRTHVSAVKVKTLMYSPPELPHQSQVQVTISAIGEDGLIYVMTDHAERQFEQLRKRIQQHMKALPRQRPYTWKSVQGCAVIGSDLLWYRGQVLEVIGGQVKVRYVDTGLVENIPVVHVYPTLLCEDIPQLSIPCQLHAVIPVGRKWQWDAVALLKELLLNRCVDMQVMELPLNPRDCLTVQISLKGMTVSRIMCHHQHASLDPSVSTQEEHIVASPVPFLLDWDIDTKGLEDPGGPVLASFSYPSLPEEGEVFRVKIKHLQTPNEVYLCPLEETAEVEVDGETLEEALTRITKDIDSLPLLSDFPPQGPCLAEYSDGKYYRAKLMDFASSEPIQLLVQHVDFGSDDTLPTSKLRQMSAELLRFPAKAVKVRVAGFRAPKFSQEREMLPYCPEWSMKAALDMIELLHGNITASVMAREPELTVFLYNERGELVHLPLVACGLADFD